MNIPLQIQLASAYSITKLLSRFFYEGSCNPLFMKTKLNKKNIAQDMMANL